MLRRFDNWTAWTVLVALVAVFLPPIATADGAESRAPVTVGVPAVLHDFHPGSIGFNSPMGALGEPKGTYRSDSMERALQEFTIQALRFPGGTVANYFDWKSGTFVAGALEKSGKQSLLDMQAERQQDGGAGPAIVDFESFYAFTKQHRLRRFVVLNLLSNDIEEVLKTIDRIKKNQPGVYFWELGNELSQPEYRKRPWSTDAWNARVYAGLASRVARHVAAHYPEDRVGIVTAQVVEGRVPGVRNLEKIESGLREWDRSVAGVPDVDAVIVHPYVLSEKKFIHRVLDTAADTDVLPGLQDRVDDVRWRWIFACAQEVPGIYLDRVRHRFPAKSVWITESGLSEDRDKDRYQAQQSMRRVLFNLSYFASWMRRYPEWDTLLFHGLFSGKGHMAAYGPGLGRNANFLSYAYLARLLNDAAQVGYLDIKGGPTYKGTGEYASTDIRALNGLFVRSASGKQRVLLLNTGPWESEVRLPFAMRARLATAAQAMQPVAEIEPLAVYDAGSGTTEPDRLRVPPFSVMLVSDTAGDLAGL